MASNANLLNLQKWYSSASIPERQAMRVRTALRALPLATLGQDWSPASAEALLRIFRSLHFQWTSLAYSSKNTEGGWNEERIQALKTLWNNGYTASDISGFLGNVSRNATIGKAHRLGLQSNPNLRNIIRAPGVSGADVQYFTGELQHYAAISVISALNYRPSTSKPDQDDFSSPFFQSLFIFNQTFPSFDPHIAEEATYVDLKDMTKESSTAIVLGRRLWPIRDSFPAKINVPTNPPRSGWPFWRRWYDARNTGRPTEVRNLELSEKFDRTVAMLSSQLWESQPAIVNNKIIELSREIRLDYRKASLDDNEVELIDPNALGQVEDQSSFTTVFIERENHLITVDPTPYNDSVLNDPDAIDRHTEVCDSARDLIGLFTRFGLGSNVTETLVQHAERLLESLGESPEHVRPGLLIPRGERLRQKLVSQTNLDDIGADPPLPAQYLSSLKVLIASYNVYVALDPALARRDEVTLGPDIVSKNISPSNGNDLALQAVSDGIADSTVAQVIIEQGGIAPAIPTASNRNSRRFSETVRNFIRIAVDRAFNPIRSAWHHRSALVELGKGANKFTTWVGEHANSLIALFPEHSTMRNIIKFIADFVQKPPT